MEYNKLNVTYNNILSKYTYLFNDYSHYRLLVGQFHILYRAFSSKYILNTSYLSYFSHAHLLVNRYETHGKHINTMPIVLVYPKVPPVQYGLYALPEIVDDSGTFIVPTSYDPIQTGFEKIVEFIQRSSERIPPLVVLPSVLRFRYPEVRKIVYIMRHDTTPVAARRANMSYRGSTYPIDDTYLFDIFMNVTEFLRFMRVYVLTFGSLYFDFVPLPKWFQPSDAFCENDDSFCIDSLFDCDNPVSDGDSDSSFQYIL